MAVALHSNAEIFAANRATGHIVLGDHLVVMDRGSIVYSCDRATMDEGALKRALAI